MAWKTGSPSVAKAAGQISQPRDRGNTEGRKFFGSSAALSQPREGDGIIKSGESVDGLQNSGGRLHPSGTRKASSQGEAGRKASGNGRGHDG
jgi:hypothetical protein